MTTFRDAINGLTDSLEKEIRGALIRGDNMEGRSFIAVAFDKQKSGIGRITISIEPPSVVEEAVDDAEEMLQAYYETENDTPEPDSLGD